MSRKQEFEILTLEERLELAKEHVTHFESLQHKDKTSGALLQFWMDVVENLQKTIEAKQ